MTEKITHSTAKQRRRHRRIVTTATALTLMLSACGTSDGSTGGSDGTDAAITVVATTTMLGDVARNVVGDAGTVVVLLPVGVDPHEYQASSREVALIQTADLVITNGLGLEEGMADILASAAQDGANILEIAPASTPLPFGEDGLDPHVWFDPIRMAEGSRMIAASLETIDPGSGWTERAETYAAQLMVADAEVISLLETLGPDDRRLVTNHDSLGYFANRYSFDVIGVVVPGGSTLSNPSSSALSELAHIVATEGVPAIFAETTDSAALAEAVASEVDSEVAVVDLYSGSLGEPGSEADTLIGMLLTNARLIAEALG